MELVEKQAFPYHPWDERYIYLQFASFYGFHVGKYASPMDALRDL